MKELDFLFVTPKAPLTARWYPPPDNIVDINGDKWIVGHRHKTGIPFQVKLMDVSIQIIDRYKHLQEDKLVFGKMRSTFGRLARPRTTGQCARSRKQ